MILNLVPDREKTKILNPQLIWLNDNKNLNFLIEQAFPLGFEIKWQKK